MRTKIATAILAGLLASPAMAQPPVTAQPASVAPKPAAEPKTHEPAPMMALELGPTMILEMRDELKLTESQVAQLRTIEDSANQSVRPHLTKHMEGMQVATAMLDAATPDLTAYDASVREATNHMVLAHSALARVDLQAREVLNPEQRVQLASARKMAHELKEGAMRRGTMKDEPKKDGSPPSIPPRP